ncbi:hypothetical protein NX059_000879 [Plenodomus lindquistii]|nr:hypothetical protein NX059_000879 [Plenodomus lindquistii]
MSNMTQVQRDLAINAALAAVNCEDWNDAITIAQSLRKDTKRLAKRYEEHPKTNKERKAIEALSNSADKCKSSLMGVRRDLEKMEEHDAEAEAYRRFYETPEGFENDMQGYWKVKESLKGAIEMGEYVKTLVFEVGLEKLEELARLMEMLDEYIHKY